MQEAKRFSTALFGFDRKAVLDYIYEQDKQAREALEELAVRNDTLDRKAAELNEKLEAMSAQYKQAVSDSKEKERQLNEQGSDARACGSAPISWPRNCGIRRMPCSCRWN